MGYDQTQAPSAIDLTVIQNAQYVYDEDAQASDAYEITLDPAPASYVEGQIFRFKANTANTGASSLNVNGLGAVTLKKKHDQDTETGDIEDGSIVEVIYDGTNFQILSGLASSEAPSADSITNNELANMSAYTFKGRYLGTTGDPQDVGVSDLTEDTIWSTGDYLSGHRLPVAIDLSVVC